MAEFRGQELFLNGLTTLTLDVAKSLAECKGFDLRLSALTAVDNPDFVAIAKTLATHKGPLAVHILKKSPQDARGPDSEAKRRNRANRDA